MAWIEVTDCDDRRILVATDAVLVVEELGDCRRVVLRERLFDGTVGYLVKEDFAVIRNQLIANCRHRYTDIVRTDGIVVSTLCDYCGEPLANP